MRPKVFQVDEDVPLDEQSPLTVTVIKENKGETQRVTFDELLTLIGFGTFHWKLLAICGLGWFADDMWLQVIPLIMPVIQNEFKVDDFMLGLLPSSQLLGGVIGGFTWGFVSDLIGRKWAFTLTLLFSATFGLISAFVPNYPLFLIAQVLTGFGLGGGLPVDGAMFAEFISKERRGRLMVLLSSFWILGPLFASGLAWAILPNFSCVDDACLPENNMGWRYVLGGCAISNFLMLLSRRGIPESPHWYYKTGKREEAIAVLKEICVYNGVKYPNVELVDPEVHQVNFCATLKKRNMLGTLLLLICIWICVLSGYNGFNSFLPILMEAKGVESNANIYRNMFIYMSAGLPGSLLGAYLVDTWLGRRWTLLVSACFSAIAMFFFLLLESEVDLILFSSIFQFMVQIVWASMATYTPEYFPTDIRGTAVGMCSSIARSVSLFAPTISGILITEVSPEAAMYVSFGMTLAIGLFTLGLSVDTKGRNLD